MLNSERMQFLVELVKSRSQMELLPTAICRLSLLLFLYHKLSIRSTFHWIKNNEQPKNGEFVGQIMTLLLNFFHIPLHSTVQM